MSNDTKQAGPTSSAGKEHSSANATTHGGTSEQLIVAGERHEDFEALLNHLLDEFSPPTANTRGMVEDAALARWFLWRRQRAFNAIETALYAAEPNEAKWSAEAHQKLALADRYKTTAERAFKRAFSNLQVLRKNGQDDRRLELLEQRHEILERRDARLGKKEEAQAELAAAHASDSLRALDARKWKDACRGFDRPTLVQNISVTVSNGFTRTTMTPTSTELLLEVDRPQYPPVQVCRHFLFFNGMPPEYYSFAGNEPYRRQKDHTMDQRLSIETWCEMVKEERKLGHALPGPQDFVS